MSREAPSGRLGCREAPAGILGVIEVEVTTYPTTIRFADGREAPAGRLGILDAEIHAVSHGHSLR